MLGKFFWGVLLLMVGVIWLSMVFGWIDDINVLAHWWPMLIIVPCALRLFFAKDRFLSIMGIIIGLIWQIHYWAPEMIDLSTARMSMPPVVIICIALHLLMGRKGTRSNRRK